MPRLQKPLKIFFKFFAKQPGPSYIGPPGLGRRRPPKSIYGLGQDRGENRLGSSRHCYPGEPKKTRLRNTDESDGRCISGFGPIEQPRARIQGFPGVLLAMCLLDLRLTLKCQTKCLIYLERAMGFEPTTPTLARLMLGKIQGQERLFRRPT